MVFDAFGHRCAACGADDRELVLDHHRPLHTGSPLLHNAVPLCRNCNCRKNDKPPEVFDDSDTLWTIELQLVWLRWRYENHTTTGTSS
jgi:5-methylcytosine-specific restriction endonuclease McrA